MYFKKSKKGVSPLIATVLLIAFAVSLGAVVINLGVNLFGNPCTSRTAEILTVEGNTRLCHLVDTKTLSLTVVNTGTQTIDGVKLTVVGNVAYNEDIPEKLDSLEKKVISYPLPDMVTIDLVTIIPFYEKQGKIKYCSQNARDYTQVPRC